MWKACYISRGYLKKLPLIFIEPVMKCRVDKSDRLRVRSVAAPDLIWRLQNRVDMKPRSDLEVSVQSIW